ncbi:MAG: class I SAM-dependent methyltransferase [Gammaproteobacteria bacterium]|nr:class I SAM-dependent methyltransferase [Gammaproteobacteria bacterium]
MKQVDFGPLRRWTSKGLELSNGAGETFHSADDTNSFTMLVGRAVAHIDPRLVIDLGCGCGIPTIEAAARGALAVQGVDISEANAALARRNVSRARLDGRVGVHCADWRELLHEARPDLLVSNPPYVPQGAHPTVNGGPDGADVVRAMIDAVPDSTRGVALLFGSISNPVSVVQHIEERGWRVGWLSCHGVPFGLYTSRPATVVALRALQREGRAWFHEAELGSGSALRTYVVFGLIAERGKPGNSLADAMTCLLVRFQRHGWKALQDVVLPVPFDCGTYRAATLPENAAYSFLDATVGKHDVMTAARHGAEAFDEAESMTGAPGALAVDPGVLLSDSAS